MKPAGIADGMTLLLLVISSGGIVNMCSVELAVTVDVMTLAALDISLDGIADMESIRRCSRSDGSVTAGYILRWDCRYGFS